MISLYLYPNHIQKILENKLELITKLNNSSGLKCRPKGLMLKKKKKKRPVSGGCSAIRRLNCMRRAFLYSSIPASQAETSHRCRYRGGMVFVIVSRRSWWQKHVALVIGENHFPLLLHFLPQGHSARRVITLRGRYYLL